MHYVNSYLTIICKTCNNLYCRYALCEHLPHHYASFQARPSILHVNVQLVVVFNAENW